MAETRPTEDDPLAGALIQSHRRGYERVLVSLMFAGAGLSILGHVLALLATSTSSGVFRAGGMIIALSLMAIVVAVEMSYPLGRLRTVFVRSRGSDSYERLRRWTRLKTASILLNLIVLLGGLLVVAGLLSRTGALDVNVTFARVLRLNAGLTLVMSMATLYALSISLRTPTKKETRGIEAISVHSTSFLAILLGLGAVLLIVLERNTLNAGVTLRLVDTPVYFLAAFSLAGLAAFVARGLPTVYALFTEERDFYQGRSYLSRKKSVLMPTMIAFALLFMTLLVLLVFQVGVIGLVEEVPKNFVLLGVMVFIIIALVAAAVASFTLSRSEDHVRLFETRRPAEKRRELMILGISIALAVAFFAIAALLFSNISLPFARLSSGRWIDFFCFGLMSAIGPYGFYYSRRQKRIRLLEERFPDFLRDLAASRRAGLTLDSSVRIAAKGEYGALTPEIKKMADQLSWNVPFIDALERFGNRVSTPLVQRAVSLVREASFSGGNVTDVLLAAANDAREIKNLENERRANMALYSIIVYITFFVFLVVVGILFATFIPQLIAASEAAIAGGTANVGGISFGDVLSRSEYRVFYFTAAVMQGLGNGVVAGLMESGRALNGLRHSFIMVAITYVCFTFFLA